MSQFNTFIDQFSIDQSIRYAYENETRGRSFDIDELFDPINSNLWKKWSSNLMKGRFLISAWQINNSRHKNQIKSLFNHNHQYNQYDSFSIFGFVENRF
jgi:hypothetical protein